MSAANDGTFPCSVPGCVRQAYRDSESAPCWAHKKRLQRGAPLDGPMQEKLSLWARLVEAAICLADADSENDAVYQAAEENFRANIRRWCKRNEGNESGPAPVTQEAAR